MAAAQNNYTVVDRSTILASLAGMKGIIAMPANKGKRSPQLITGGHDELVKKYGEADPKLGVAQYSAKNHLSESSTLWVNRVAHDDCTYAGVLVKGKVNSLPTNIPAANYVVDKIVTPITGLTQAQLDTFEFNLYSTNREYDALSTKVVEDSTGVSFYVNKLSELTVGKSISFGSVTSDDSILYEIKALEKGVNKRDKLQLSTVASAMEGSAVRRVIKEVASFSTQIKTTTESLAGQPVIKVTALADIMSGHTLVLGSNKYVVSEVNTTALTVTFTTPLVTVVAPGTEVKIEKRTYSTYSGVTVLKTISGSDEVLVSNSDLIGNGETITFTSGLTFSDIEFTVLSKDIYDETFYKVTVDNSVSVTTQSIINLMVHSEFEERECFLVVNANEGAWGNTISIGTAPSSDYDEAFYLLVYDSGVLVESHHVTRKQYLDGYGNQMYIEDVINDKSDYIRVVNNLNYVDDNEEPILPLYTDYSVWRQKEEDYFMPTGYTILEDLVLGDTDVKVSDFSLLNLGRRIRFNDNTTIEYKIINKYSTDVAGEPEYHIVLDRELVQDKVAVGTPVLYFDSTYTDETAGIYNGVKCYKLSKLPNVYYNYAIKTTFTISSVVGWLLDSGVNLMTGGFNGSAVTLSDMIAGIKVFSNKDEYPGQIILDGGFARPEYAQAVSAVVEARGGGNFCHGFLSMSLDAEQSSDYKAAIVAYKNSLNLNTANCSIFTGWIKEFDDRNQIYVWVSPEAIAAASQSFTTRNYSIFTPAAGYKRGLAKGLDVVRRYSQGDMDYFEENRINSIKYEKGVGLIVWGNETLYVKPSPLQLRSVAFLLIYIVNGLDSFLKYVSYDFNDPDTWRSIENAINVFMRDQVKAKRGVYEYVIAVEKVITDSDIDNRKIPVFLGIKPTMDAKMIDTRVAIFNKSATISVSW